MGFFNFFKTNNNSSNRKQSKSNTSNDEQSNTSTSSSNSKNEIDECVEERIITKVILYVMLFILVIFVAVLSLQYVDKMDKNTKPDVLRPTVVEPDVLRPTVVKPEFKADRLPSVTNPMHSNLFSEQTYQNEDRNTLNNFDTDRLRFNTLGNFENESSQ